LPAFLRAAGHDTTVPMERGDAAWPPDGQQHRADYFKPYLAHAAIGPSCAVAWWDAGELQVWTHSQGLHNLRDDIVLALARSATPLRRQDIVIRHVEGAGCCGHNGADDVAFDAVLMALVCPGAAGPGAVVARRRAGAQPLRRRAVGGASGAARRGRAADALAAHAVGQRLQLAAGPGAPAPPKMSATAWPRRATRTASPGAPCSPGCTWAARCACSACT
jgi:CO/xanthine dehydrogenase Mo-binding subunit